MLPQHNFHLSTTCGDGNAYPWVPPWCDPHAFPLTTASLAPWPDGFYSPSRGLLPSQGRGDRMLTFDHTGGHAADADAFDHAGTPRNRSTSHGIATTDVPLSVSMPVGGSISQRGGQHMLATLRDATSAHHILPRSSIGNESTRYDQGVRVFTPTRLPETLQCRPGRPARSTRRVAVVEQTASSFEGTPTGRAVELDVIRPSQGGGDRAPPRLLANTNVRSSRRGRRNLNPPSN